MDIKCGLLEIQKIQHVKCNKLINYTNIYVPTCSNVKFFATTIERLQQHVYLNIKNEQIYFKTFFSLQRQF